MKNRFIALLLTCFALTLSLSAESSIFDIPMTPTSRTQLTAVCTKIAANPVVRGRFTQTKQVTRIKKNFSSYGNFLFSGSDGVLWNVEKPYPSSLIMTKDRLIQKTAGGRTSVMESNGNAVFQRFADTLQAVFAGRLSSLEQDFSLYFQGTATNWRIGLVPKENAVRSVIKSMEIRGDDYILSLRLVEASGDLNVYTFSDSQASKILSEDEKQAFLFSGE